MKAFICSDLHLEYNQVVKLPDADVIIIAGDYSCSQYFEEGIKKLCDTYEHVIFVAGNHEFYGKSFSETEDILSEIQISNFYWLENREVKIGNTRIIGTTLWFQNMFDNIMYERFLADFSTIKNFRKEVYKRNTKAVNYLTKTDIKDAIIVTHHLPSFNSVASEFFFSKLNRFFVCDLEALIVKKQPKVWIHGHTHSNMDYNIMNTRVLCNPLGYPFEKNPGYSLDVVIDI